MKFIRLIFLLVLFMLHDLHSQGGFRKKYFLDKSLNSSSYDAFETPAGNFIMTGITVDSLNNIAYNKLTLIGTDKNGAFQWRKDFGTFNFEYRDIWQTGNGTVLDTNGFYQTLCVKDYLTNKENAVLIRFNYNGDTLWQRVYEADSIERFYAQGLSRSVDGGFLISGICINFGITKGQTCLLIKAGKDGTELWRKKISKNVPNTQAGFSNIQDSATKRIIVVGYQYIGTASTFATYSSVLFLDSLGNKIMQKSYNNASGGTFGEIRQLNDGNFISGGQWCYDYDNVIYQPFLVKFDIDGNIIWTRKYNPPGYASSAGFFYELPNSDLIFMGKLDNTPDSVRLQLIQTDSQGNLKAIKNLNNNRAINNAEGCSSMKPTTDGGFVFATRFLSEPQPMPFSIIKIDSLGCDTSEAYCRNPVGLREHFINSGFYFQVFPNPASAYVSISTNKPEGKPLVLKVTDLSGRVMLEPVEAGSDFQMDVSALSEGLYFFSLFYEGRVVEVKKVLIAR